jgi:hypothetical protein
MSGRPVNIAEFRCRAMRARTAEFSLRIASRSTGLKVVDPSAADNRVVFDIGMARDAQRFRRPKPQSISIQQRAKVIRFGEGRRLAAAAMHANDGWRVPNNGPFDFPPAA